MNATIEKATEDLTEVAALRIAQMGLVDETQVATLVRDLRRAFPEWRSAYGPDVLATLCERFGLPLSNATALYFDVSARA